MNTLRSIVVSSVLIVTFIFPIAVLADSDDRAPADVTVQFGEPVFPQSAPPANHFLLPNEVTIKKGGTVTFDVNGGGHGIAIVPVNKKTSRIDIEEDLCGTATCIPLGAITSDLQYFVTDSKGDLVINTGTNPPSNRVDSPKNRLLYAGGGSFLVGLNPLATPPVPATKVQYRFEKTGRYLVHCINRGHFINDRMFGFVNVVGGD
jgi:hypothetical protein